MTPASQGRVKMIEQRHLSISSRDHVPFLKTPESLYRACSRVWCITSFEKRAISASVREIAGDNSFVMGVGSHTGGIENEAARAARGTPYAILDARLPDPDLHRVEFDALEPRCFSPYEEAARRGQRDWEKARFDDRADGVSACP